MEAKENRKSRDTNTTPIIIAFPFHSGSASDWLFVKRMYNANISHIVVTNNAIALIVPSVLGSMVLNRLFMTVIFL
jgi:hypothetical protein